MFWRRIKDIAAKPELRITKCERKAKAQVFEPMMEYLVRSHLALDLDFVTVGDEEYDLLVSLPLFESERGARLMDVIRSDEFKRAVAGLGGYDTTRTGELLYRQ